MTRTQLSVSLGAGAFPEVKEAIKHAAENPDHDPFIICILTEPPDESVGQRIVWMCHACRPWFPR